MKYCAFSRNLQTPEIVIAILEVMDEDPALSWWQLPRCACGLKMLRTNQTLTHAQCLPGRELLPSHSAVPERLPPKTTIRTIRALFRARPCLMIVNDTRENARRKKAQTRRSGARLSMYLQQTGIRSLFNLLIVGLQSGDKFTDASVISDLTLAQIGSNETFRIVVWSLPAAAYVCYPPLLLGPRFCCKGGSPRGWTVVYCTISCFRICRDFCHVSRHYWSGFRTGQMHENERGQLESGIS
jgi:hypothetical protein